MQSLLRRDCQAAFLGHGDEVSEVSELHGAIPEKYGFELTKSFSRAPARSTSPATAAEIPDPATTAFGIGISGETQQAYVADRRRVSGGPTKDRIMSTQVVLITGGLTGIGRAAAVAFDRKGAKVVVAGRRDEAGNALVKELRSFGSEAEFINADVRKEVDVRAMVDKTVARFGRIDVAVNNAATEGAVGPITDQTAESFAATFETNVLGVVLSMKHEVRAMQGQCIGTILNISSTYGLVGAVRASIYVGR